MNNATPETWIPIFDYPAYEVSDQGRVRRGRRLLKCTPGPNGYPKTRLGRGTPDMYVHRMVLKTFVGDCPDGFEVRHLDGVRSNNVLANLQYGSHGENIKDQVRHGTNHWANKTHCPRGHEYDAANTYITVRGSRSCRTCQKRAHAEWRRRNPGK